MLVKYFQTYRENNYHDFCPLNITIVPEVFVHKTGSFRSLVFCYLAILCGTRVQIQGCLPKKTRTIIGEKNKKIVSKSSILQCGCRANPVGFTTAPSILGPPPQYMTFCLLSCIIYITAENNIVTKIPPPQ